MSCKFIALIYTLSLFFARIPHCVSQDDTSKSSSAANELGLANVGGVFVVLMGGMGVACVIAVCEFVWKSRKVAVEERVSGMGNCRFEFKLLILFLFLE